MELIPALFRHWYLLLSRFSAALTVPVSDLADRVDWPVLTVLLFGLVGAVSPCQLTTNLSAMAYVGSRLEERRPWREALAYIAGKVLVYTVAGAAVIAVGLQLQAAAIPVVVAARKALGPLMIVIGLGFVGILRLRGSVGYGFAASLQARLPRQGISRAFLLGVAFSFAFCPTLFWLFFGLTIPLALRSAAGWSFPGLFALGTALPLVAFTGLLALGGGAAGRFVERLTGSHRLVSRVAGVIFILTGIHDTLTYWAL
ncbi:MAG TPA: sulfite exporter TauE/SafE family protein [Methylomirabilota bacterium]|jgi:sulfite exporter TauE/SafE|nr:sulfite exporter TauE/SafE family protein [Methylomirabilota bacterium]